MFCEKCGQKLLKNSKSCSSCGVILESINFNKPIKSPKNKRLGIILVLSPFVLIVLVLLAYTIVTFVSAALDDGQGVGSLGQNITTIINYFLGLIGLIAVGGTIVCVPLGIVLIVKNKDELGNNYDKRSGASDASEIPSEIVGWNWGAAGLSFIWGIYYKVWISLLIFIPYLNLIWWIVLGIKGNEWAWRKNKWKNVEHFKITQAKWRPWGIAVFFIPIAIVILGILMGTILPRLTGAQERARLLSQASSTNNENQNSGELKGAIIPYTIKYNNKWAPSNAIGSKDAEFELGHTKGEAWAFVIAERLELTKEGLKNIAINNAKSADEDAEIIFEEDKQINGRNILALKIRATISGMPLIYYNYYYSSSLGTIQFITATPKNLFSEYENDLKELLDSLEVRGIEITGNVDECQKYLPSLKERLFAEYKKQYLVNHLYSDISDVEIIFSPTLNHCIYTLEEQFFIYKEGGATDGMDLYAKIYDYTTDKKLFSVIIGTKNGENMANYRQYRWALESYIGGEHFE